jgi:hypothetical protein
VPADAAAGHAMEEEYYRVGWGGGAIDSVAEGAVVWKGEGEGFVGLELEFGGIRGDGRRIRGRFGAEHLSLVCREVDGHKR